MKPRDMTGEQLRNERRKSSRALGDEIVRLRATDERFRAVLDWDLALDEEADRRKNPRSQE